MQYLIYLLVLYHLLDSAVSSEFVYARDKDLSLALINITYTDARGAHQPPGIVGKYIGKKGSVAGPIWNCNGTIPGEKYIALVGDCGSSSHINLLGFIIYGPYINVGTYTHTHTNTCKQTNEEIDTTKRNPLKKYPNP